MKKREFKIIKKYPGSLDVGTVLYLDNNLYIYWGTSLSRKEVENNPEFFQEIIQKDYEILSLKSISDSTQSRLYVLHSNGLYGFEDEEGFAELQMALMYWKINSIKRKSDNEVFSIGDNVDWKSHKNHYKITEIKFFNDVPVIVLSSKNVPDQLSSSLSSITKSKPVLFVTEDGKEIKTGDEYFVYFPSENKIYGKYIAHNNGENWTVKHLNFSSKEKAQEFIVLNKPCLSLNDVYKTKQMGSNLGFVFDVDELITLVKSRL